MCAHPVSRSSTFSEGFEEGSDGRGEPAEHESVNQEMPTKPASTARVSFSLSPCGQQEAALDKDEGPYDEVFCTEVTDSPLLGIRRNRHQTTVSIQSAPPIFRLDSADSQGSRVEERWGPRKVKNYYKKQWDLLQSYDDDEKTLEEFKRKLSVEELKDGSEPEEEKEEVKGPGPEVDKKNENLFATVTLLLNVVLLVLKTVAVVLSGSLSIISSLVDSAVDITSGLVVWMTARAIRTRDPYLYPRGRTRLEPIALIIISVVMAVASIQLIVHSIEAIVAANIKPDIGVMTVGIMGFTIAVKLVLAILCHFYRSSPSIRVLAQDHRNDCISNSVAIVCAYLGERFWVYLDPIGAIIVSIYIAGSWFVTGYGQISILSGRSAKPAYINRIIKISMEHDERIRQIDTVYVYHWGSKFLVEVHIVLDQEMTLKEAHDISEPLQRKLEHLSYVERAFVHVDYEISHRPEDEHKVV